MLKNVHNNRINYRNSFLSEIYSDKNELCEMHVLLLGYRPALKKNLNFVFY